ncbi:hypothetical protein ANOM_000048 [Aspergillus nomiae NRRL 13137]|uniref:C2H2-type domain-containing protein n=1 Tax=Aspergillus nomiae NRRL (strain ATCC 15546 / NRRL 13137 / CBS 260.88 / M93) TaxID=1509407 RepID=A0A0L1JJE2_ASPN3|nr:uncharacterized protein ANOM_000048 [Aspergillus nomiae NRRL 13137]KNG91508.1 hypothetical protein ANOM_000048 [Aspergillus nomiae NRRL 13137]
MAWFPADPNWTGFYLPRGTEQELEDFESILRDIPQPASQQHAMSSDPQHDLPTVDATSPDLYSTSLMAPSTNDNPGLSNQATIGGDSLFPNASNQPHSMTLAPRAEQPSEQLANPRAAANARTARTPRRSLQPGGNGSTLFRCGWKDCTYDGTFGREAELMRHVKLLHVSPRSYECRMLGCGRVFNRRDNLLDHRRRAHPIQQ